MSTKSFFCLAWTTARLIVVLGLALGAIFVPTQKAAAIPGTYWVNRRDDIAPRGTGVTCLSQNSDDCTLREAVIKANENPGSTIRFDAARTDGTPIILTRSGNDADASAGDLDINANTTIIGNGATNTIIQGAANASYTGSIGDKIFGVNQDGYYPSLTVSFSDMTIRYGDNTIPWNDTTWAQTGGGVDVYQTGAGNSASFTNVVIAYNRNHNSYGGGLNFAQSSYAPAGHGSLTLDNVTFEGNQTMGQSGDDPAGGWQGGGACLRVNDSTITISNSTFLNNSTPASGTTSEGGAIYFFPTLGGSLTITNSTFSGNSSRIGGAISVATYNPADRFSIQNSSITGNSAGGAGGGLYLRTDGFANTNPFQLTNLAISGNQAGTSGGGIYVDDVNVTVEYSRIVNNTATADPSSSGLYKTNQPETVTAEKNWWGCSAGPGAAPCDRAFSAAGGTLTTNPWLQARLTASSTTLVTNQSSALEASFLQASDGSAVSPSNLGQIIGQPLSWSAPPDSISGAQTTVQPSGIATATFTATSVGSAVVGALLDNDSLSAGSNRQLITINKANTTTTIANAAELSSTPSLLGQLVTVSASVTGAYGNSPTAPGGTITVSDGVDSCTVTLPAASCNLTLHTLGARTITATYNGDDNFNGDASDPVTHTVQSPPQPTTTTLTSDINPSLYGQGVTFTATVSPAPTGGTVEFRDGAVTITGCGTQALTGGQATCLTSALTVGAHNVTAVYSGAAGFESSTSAPLTQAVNKANTTISVTSSPNPSGVLGLVEIIATVNAAAPGGGNPTGLVQLYANGAPFGSPLELQPDQTVHMTTTDFSVGEHPLTATYAGDGSFNGSGTASAWVHTVEAAPSVTIDQAGAQLDPTNVGPINFTVIFSENVTDFDDPADVSLSGPGTLSFVITGGPATYNVAVSGMTGSGTVSASIPAGAAQDALGSPSTASTSTDNEVSYDFDPPDTQIDYPMPPGTSGSSSVRFYFSSPDPTAAFECRLDDGDFSACSSPQDYTGLTNGSHSFSVRARDAAGNVDPTPAPYTWMVDVTPPVVRWIVRLSANPTTSDNVSFTVEFSEPVLNVDAGDFELATTGSLAGTSITSVGSGTTVFIVSANTGTGQGTLRLDLRDNDSIVDPLGTPLGGEGEGNGDFTAGEAFDVRPPLAPGVYEDTYAAWSYAGYWPTYSGPGPSGSTLHYTYGLGNSAQTLINGSQFRLTYTASPNYGIVNVFVDDVQVGSFNQNSTPSGWQKTWTSNPMTAGIHKVRLVKASSGLQINLDAIQVMAVASTVLQPGKHDDPDAALTYSTGWFTASGLSGPYSGTLHYTYGLGNSAQTFINGAQFKLTYTASSNYGIVDVYVDDVRVGSFDQNSSPSGWQKTWTSNPMTAGIHKVRLVKASSGLQINLDAIEVLETASTVLGPGKHDNLDAAFSYSSGWFSLSGMTGPYLGTLHYTYNIHNSAQVFMNGTQFRLIYTASPNYGLVDVYIDDVKVATIDQNSSPSGWQKTWTSNPLTAGIHKVKFVKANSGLQINIDAIEVLP